MEKKSGFGSVYLFVLGVITVICCIIGIKIHALGEDLGKGKNGNIEIGEFSELKVDLNITSVHEHWDTPSALRSMQYRHHGVHNPDTMQADAG